MALIRIEEKTTPGPDGTNATLSFEHGPKYDITIIDPFTPQEEEALAWYFEEHMRYPMLKLVRAQKAAVSVTTYGEELFVQVFANPDAYADYRQVLKDGLSKL